MAAQPLVKSKKSALLMAVICALAALVTSTAWSLAAGEPILPRLPQSGLPSGASSGAILAVVALILVITAALAFYMIFYIIDRLDETHYGLRGAVGWAAVGCLTMLADRAIHLYFPGRGVWFTLLFGAAMLLAYFLVFRLALAAGGRRLLVIFLLFSLMAPSRPVRAAAVLPCSTADLVAAINASNADLADDVIDLQPGCTYLLVASDNTTWGGNGLPVIADQATAGKLTINGNGAAIMRGLRVLVPLVFSPTPAGSAAPVISSAAVPGDGDFRILRVAAGGSLTLNNVTLSGGALWNENGGAISNSGTLVVNNSTILENAAVMGGGIYNLGKLTVANSMIESNTAATTGGGISSGGELTVSSSTFSGNDAVLGDGVLIAEGASTVSSSTFSGDSAYTCPAFPVAVFAGDVTALVNAIHCANAGPSNSAINLTKGTYTLTTADNHGFGSGDTGLPVVWDASEAGALVLNGNDARIERSSAAGTPEFRLWMIHSGGDLTVNKVSLANGRLSAAAGGCFNVDNGRLTLNQAGVTFCRADYAGAIVGYTADITITDSQLGYGATTHDGAAMVMTGTLKMTRGMVVGNNADGLSGGIIINSGIVEISDSLFTQNRSFGLASGGALLIAGQEGSPTTVNISSSTFSYNTGTGAGGVFFSTPNTLTTIVNSTFSGNSAGWGVIDNRGTLNLAHCTISGNQSMNTSGGLSNLGTLTLYSTIIAGNTTTHDSPDIQGTVESKGYNLIGSTTGATITGNLTGNLTADPAAPLYLGPVDWNGGPTQTMALLAGSPAINAGDPAFTPPPDYDQRGPGFLRVANGRVDIGAFERQ